MSWAQNHGYLLPKNACRAGNPRVDYSTALFRDLVWLVPMATRAICWNDSAVSIS
jgi:hypothetical protein